MTAKFFTGAHLIASLLSVLLTQSSAHTWNEQLAVISSSGKFTGAYGYPRGYVERTDPGFNDDMMTYLLPPDGSNRTRIDSQDLLCAPTQRSANQTTGFPRLSVAPGSHVAMKYLENGHVTLPQNQLGKPPKAGSVYVFGTSNPNPSETLMDVMLWNTAGTGGDGRGVLLAAQNFDDGRCHQINGGTMSLARQKRYPDPTPGQPGTHNELWCETDIQIPTTGLKTGQLYTIYWVWQWPTAPGGADPTYPDGKDEYYTTCSDFQVVASQPQGPVSKTLVQQDPMPHADATYLHRTALTPVPSAWGQSAASAAPASTQVQAPEPAATAAASTAFSFTLAASSTAAPPAALTSISLLPLYDPHLAAAAPTPAPGAASGAGGGDNDNIMTATILVTASMAPGESTLVVRGTHVVTFVASAAPTSAGYGRRRRRGVEGL